MHRSRPLTAASTITQISYAAGNQEQLLVCVKCASVNSVSDRVFSHSTISPVAYLGFLLGPLGALIALALTSRNHLIGVPMCKACWSTYRLASWGTGLAIILFCFAIAGGVWMMIQFDSGYLFWVLPIISTAAVAYSFYRKQSAAPRVIYADKLKMVIDGGTYGEITFSYRATITGIKTAEIGAGTRIRTGD